MKKRKLEKLNGKLRKLIRHAWVHTAYRDCGYMKMTTEQKKLYCKVIGREYDEDYNPDELKEIYDTGTNR